MRVIIVGLGVQGHKRRQFAGNDYVAAVDPVNPNAEYRFLQDVPLQLYDAALLCIPDAPKVELIQYLLVNDKHVLVEKPLLADNAQTLENLQTLARTKQRILYTAYNHRFEPHFVHMRELINSDVLGKMYYCRLFYGNGTARLVRNSPWRDHGAGVLPDLGSHLLDTLCFWFDCFSEDFLITSSSCFENHSPDHIVLSNSHFTPKIELEMTLLSWRNHFTCDLFAEKGSAHITSLCKWGPTQFIHRTRQLPSGAPQEQAVTLVQSDPTWALEYNYFKKLCESGAETNLAVDIWLAKILQQLSQEITRSKKPWENPSLVMQA